ncbi:hypothetical protein E4U41_002999 [Claviceps citrina]|nr:hypothetical protein E4U41_002999 [Claviceps citrina]
MASPLAVDSSSTPLRNREDLAKICQGLKEWIFQAPHSPNNVISSTAAGGIATVKNGLKSPDQGSDSARRPDSSNSEAKDLEKIKTCLPELHEGSQKKPTQGAPESTRVGIEPTSMPLPESKASQLSTIIDPAEHSLKSISAPLSAVLSSSSGPSQRPTTRPFEVIQAAVPCPIAMKRTACLGFEGWSISSNCSLDHGKEMVAFVPSFAHNSASGTAYSVTLDESFNSCDGDAVHHSHDPVESWLIKHLTSPSWIVSPDEISDLINSRCDIDPEKGKFLPPILQPETFRCAREDSSEDQRDILWRRNNMTTELHIMKELKSRENMAKTLQMSAYLEADGPDVSSKSDHAWPNANCLVRPATQQDFPVVANIINENNRCQPRSRAKEDLVMRAEDVARVWDECRAENRPFIVVTPAEEDLLDQSKWPNHSEIVYKEFARFMEKHPRPALPVVGFAFITNSQFGLNRTCPEARYSGRLNLTVHPDHRHKLYGSALLDRILMTISPFYTSVVDHDWKHDKNEPKGIYEFPASRNIRQYAHLHVEVVETRGRNENDEARSQFLKKFEFEEVGRLKDVLVTKDDQRHMHWHDLVTWARTITPTSRIIGGR